MTAQPTRIVTIDDIAGALTGAGFTATVTADTVTVDLDGSDVCLGPAVDLDGPALLATFRLVVDVEDTYVWRVADAAGEEVDTGSEPDVYDETGVGWARLADAVLADAGWARVGVWEPDPKLCDLMVTTVRRVDGIDACTYNGPAAGGDVAVQDWYPTLDALVEALVRGTR